MIGSASDVYRPFLYALPPHPETNFTKKRERDCAAERERKRWGSRAHNNFYVVRPRLASLRRGNQKFYV